MNLLIKKFNGINAFSEGHAKVLVFMALGFDDIDAKVLSYPDHWWL